MNAVKKLYILIPLLFLFFHEGAFSEEIRRAAVSGMFYPEDKKELSSQISSYMDSAKKASFKGQLFALIVPHAGYVYSGHVAAWSYAQIDPEEFDMVVLIGSSHRSRFPGASIGYFDYYVTPLGQVPVAKDAAEKLLKHDSVFHFYPLVHKKEHSLEVQLPFLQTVFKELRIVTVLLGDFSLQDSKVIARHLLGLTQGKRVLYVTSTDLSHYYPYDTAVNKDHTAIEAIEKADPTAFFETVRDKKCELCGYSAVLTLLCMAEESGVKNIKLLKYANSGDVPAGSRDKVVGYAAMAVIKEKIKKKKSKIMER